MKGFQPYKPQPTGAFTQWAAMIHEKAFTKRRMLISANAFVSQTGQGVTFRPRNKNGI